MGLKLVVVESPAKAKTINRILGKEYVVKSSMGHVRDLPVKSLGVDIEHDFKPKYVNVKGRKKVIDELKKAAKDCDEVYLAPDPDREGEAIAWHLQELLADTVAADKFRRVQYNEITPSVVREAFEHPGELDMHRVDAQQARRILDRIVGYTVSPMLWRRIRRGLSAGRVQSVALRLVCEREAEISAFVPQEYWIMGAQVRKLVMPLDPFNVKLTRIDNEKAEITSSEQAEEIRSDLDGAALRVQGISTKVVSKRSQAPFITSTLQQSGSSYCGFSPKRTMSIAQKLYEGIDLGGEHVGLITYMRTDSVTISAEAGEDCRTFIKKEYGDKYCPEKPNVFKSRKSAQEAHEAIRPTDVNRTPESLSGRLDGAELKLYRLIWQRFVASQMAPAQIEQRTAKVETTPDSKLKRHYLFQATASEVVFPGYMKATGAAAAQEAKKKEDDSDSIEKLPALREGEPLIPLEWLSERKETQPPSRYSEATLVRALENNGVGRPSTYAQTVATLYQREYVTREKRTIAPTDLGSQVNALLVKTLTELFNVNFTASMEESLDEIEKGAVNWTGMLKTFYEKFDTWMEAAKEPPVDAEKVQKALSMFDSITEWAPPVKRGRRTYSDERFVESIKKQLEKGVSPRQFSTLLTIACRYKKQIPDLEKSLESIGELDVLKNPSVQPPRESTIKKLELLKKVSMDESAESFVGSLRSRVERGRCLTDAQVRALNNVVVAHGSDIPDFEAVRDALDLKGSQVEEDNESGPLIAALEKIETWNPPVTRGKNVFDDKVFYGSLTQHFKRKGFLSVKQRGALKRMVGRYREQIPNYAELAEQFGLGKGQKTPGAKKKSAGRGRSKKKAAPKQRSAE